MNLKRIFIIAFFDLGHTLFRLKGLVFLIPFLFFWYLMLRFLLNNGGELLTSAQSLLFFSWLLNKAEIAQKLLILHPPTLSVFFIVALGTVPFFAMLSGNDQTAGDSGRQSFRYFLTRATRAEIYSGRFLSQYILMIFAFLLIVVAAALISARNDQFSNTDIIEYALNIYLLILVYILPFVAFMSLISALMSSALSSLLMSVTMYTILLVTGAYISLKASFNIIFVPSGMKEYLFNINPGDLTFAVTGLVGYTLVYVSIGWLIFRKRNI